MRRIAILITAVILSACGDSTAPSAGGLKWTSVPSPTMDRLVSIWGSSPKDIWIVGQYGQEGEVFHYDGTSWSTELRGSFFTSVWGTSASDVWAVGCCTSSISHFDGTAWLDVNVRLDVLLRAVWGTSPSNIWMVGSGGTILHYDGTYFSSWPSGTTEDLTSMWGTSSSDIWAAGFATILHYDGLSWSVSYSPENPLDKAQIWTGWSSSPTDAWALGSAGVPGKAFHYDGSTWSPASAPPVITFGMWGTASTNVWAVGAWACCKTGTQDGDSGVRHWNGNEWASVDVGPSQNRNAIWGRSDSDIWIVGDAGSIVHGVRR